MVRRKEATPELLAEAKRLYEQTLAPVDDIAGMLGLSRSNFYKRVRDGGWRGRRARVNPFEFARALSGSAMKAIMAEPAEQPRADIAALDDPTSPQQSAGDGAAHAAGGRAGDGRRRARHRKDRADGPNPSRTRCARACQRVAHAA